MSELPHLVCDPWVSSCPPNKGAFSLGIGSGEARAGDIASWLDMISAHNHLHLRIDKDIGGQEHNFMRKEVLNALITLAALDACCGAFFALECGAWSASKFREDTGPNGPGPKPVFTTEHPDGVRDEQGQLMLRAADALAMLEVGLQLAEPLVRAGKWVAFETPASQGAGSFYANSECKLHSTMFETTIFKHFAAKHDLQFVWTEQGASGAPTRKPTCFAVTRNLHSEFQRRLGTLTCTDGGLPDATSHVGKGADGYRTRPLKRYTPLLSERIARCLHASTLKLDAVAGGDTTADDSSTQNLCAAPLYNGTSASSVVTDAPVSSTTSAQPAGSSKLNTDDAETADSNNHASNQSAPNENQLPHVHTRQPYPVDSLVQVYWTKDKKWFSGQVMDTRAKTRKLKNRRVNVPEVYVKYDVDKQEHWHALHNVTIRKLTGEPDPTLQCILADRSRDLLINDNEQSDSIMALVDSMPGVQTEFDRLAQIEEELLDDTVFVMRDMQIELETGDILNKWTMFVIDADQNLKSIATSEDVSSAQHWHTPSNEKEFNRSPQRALWQTAKEMKWEQYLELRMFNWVPIDSIDTRKHRVYNTLWAYKIKLNSDLTFNKLNPRWCVKGGTMDRSIYKSFAETMRMVTFRCILAIKAGYYNMLCTFLLDCSNAFQNTRTDEPQDGKPLPKMYCMPAPTFERFDERGVRLVCELLVGMQGRIDATRLFNDRLMKILLKSGCMRFLWDRQVVVYLNGPGAGTDMSLIDVLTKIRGHKDTGAQQPPVGWAMIGWHVDDGTGLACDVSHELDPAKNRVVQYLRGQVAMTYATTLTAWHGNKSLGFTLTLDDSKKTVVMSAPDSLAQAIKMVCKDAVGVAPKHIKSEAAHSITRVPVPERGDPARDAHLAMQQLCRKVLGLCIWISNAYGDMVDVVNLLCGDMHDPQFDTLKHLRHMLMHKKAYPRSNTYGGWNVIGLETPAMRVHPYTLGQKDMSFHFFSDANVDNPSVSGGVGMLAGGPVIVKSQRQHLKAPNSHASEVVSGGDNLNLVIPTNGFLQESRIRLGASTAFYLDSATTVFVAGDDAAAKKSAWLIRRVDVLRDAVTHDEIIPIHLSEKMMVADPQTKHVTYEVWIRHMRYIMNFDQTHDGSA